MKGVVSRVVVSQSWKALGYCEFTAGYFSNVTKQCRASTAVKFQNQIPGAGPQIKDLPY